MFNVYSWKRVHLLGIGGINMSAVAKLLLNAGVTVTGSDLAASDMTEELIAKGIKIAIGPNDERNVPADCQAVIYSSAAAEDNPERVAARNRHLPEISNFEFLGAWFTEDFRVVLVTGTHGKSTTTALLGNMCIKAGLDPTVIVGSRIADWPDANLRIGKSDLVIIEGDEYAKHFLHFHPSGLIINNIELDHTDIFVDLDDMRHAFERLLRQTKREALVVANGESNEVMQAIKTVKMHAMKVIRFGRKTTSQPPSSQRGAGEILSGPYEAILEVSRNKETMDIGIDYAGEKWELQTKLIGDYNAMNITAAAVMAKELGASTDAIQAAVESFRGLWRRMELIGEKNGASVYSDYGHHPTAVRETLAAAHQAWPEKRIVLCFQPHHKNRTKHLFDDFVACFDQADVLVLCEIYDVPGRSAAEDEEMTSQKLLDSIQLRIKNEQLTINAQYAADPEAAIKQTFALLKTGDVCIIMGAGDIDAALRKQFTINN